MPLSLSSLPTTKADGDANHTAGHNATNTAVNTVAAYIDASLATTADLSTHAADTTAVHGITDTAALVTTSTAPELIRDTMASALVAGTNVTITPNDGADTITIAASGGGGGGSVDSVTAADATITIAGTATDPTVAVGTIAQSQVTALSTDLGVLRTQLFGGSARTEKPFLALSLTANTGYASGSGGPLGAAEWTVDKDTDSMWASDVVTIPITGFYRVVYFGFWTANASGTRWLELLLNGTSEVANSIGVDVANASGGGNETGQSIILARSFTAGDVLRTYAYQDSGTTLNLLKNRYGGVTTSFALEWIRPS